MAKIFASTHPALTTKNGKIMGVNRGLGNGSVIIDAPVVSPIPQNPLMWFEYNENITLVGGGPRISNWGNLASGQDLAVTVGDFMPQVDDDAVKCLDEGNMFTAATPINLGISQSIFIVGKVTIPTERLAMGDDVSATTASFLTTQMNLSKSEEALISLQYGITVTTYALFCLVRAEPLVSIYVNGTLRGSDSNESFNGVNLIAKFAGYDDTIGQVRGWYRAIIAYDRVLSDVDRVMVETYLNEKFLIY